jgi:hypothetical protein
MSYAVSERVKNAAAIRAYPWRAAKTLDTSTIFIALAGAAVSILGNALVTARAQGKTEGVIRAEIGALKDRTTKIEGEQKDQWSKIGEHSEKIGRLEGRTGRANGVAAGHGS